MEGESYAQASAFVVLTGDAKLRFFGNLLSGLKAPSLVAQVPFLMTTCIGVEMLNCTVQSVSPAASGWKAVGSFFSSSAAADIGMLRCIGTWNATRGPCRRQ